jgi:hypothetical protein
MPKGLISIIDYSHGFKFIKTWLSSCCLIVLGAMAGLAFGMILLGTLLAGGLYVFLFRKVNNVLSKTWGCGGSLSWLSPLKCCGARAGAARSRIFWS